MAMSNALNGKIMKKVVFTIPINNAPDVHIEDILFGNSLDEIEQTAEQMANDYGRKNQDVKDSKKPVRFVVEDAGGHGYLSWVNGIYNLIVNKAEDRNDETGTPKGMQSNSQVSAPSTVGK